MTIDEHEQPSLSEVKRRSRLYRAVAQMVAVLNVKEYLPSAADEALAIGKEALSFDNEESSRGWKREIYVPTSADEVPTGGKRGSK